MRLCRRDARFLFTAALLAAGLLGRSLPAQDESAFTRWEGAIAAFEKLDREKPPPQNGILFVGSSSIRWWDLAKSFPGLGAINRGFGGSQLADSVHFAPCIVLKHRPRVVVLYAGDNDIASGQTPRQVAADFEEFVRVVRKELPKTRIIYISIKPSILRAKLWDKMKEANALIEARCRKGEGLIYLDVTKAMPDADGKPRRELFVADGLHLNAKGYEVWASLLKPYLQ